MKCNIKNRPKPNDFMTEDDCFDAQGYQDRMETHFGCMEAELREFDIMRWLDKNHPYDERWANLGAHLVDTLHRFIEKEILGK